MAAYCIFDIAEIHEEYGPLREARRSATSSSAYFVAGIDEVS